VDRALTMRPLYNDQALDRRAASNEELLDDAHCEIRRAPLARERSGGDVS
jgi:hypothetical protein